MILFARLFLILTLIAGSTLMAPMRGQMAGLSQTEICSDGGAQTLVLDARGQPVAALHSCPDCLTCTSIGPLPETGAVHLARLVFQSAYLKAGPRFAIGHRTTDPTARDPPLSV